MPNTAVATPEQGQELAPYRASDETLELLLTRRSTVAGSMREPGPDAGQLRTILTAAARVPDHRKLAPFRFIVLQGEARAKAGQALAGASRADHPDFPQERIDFEGARFTRAPVVVAVVSSVKDDGKTPEWEQVLCSGAVCQNMIIAASASGFAAQWLTEWYAFDRRVLDALGLTQDERIAGFVYMGTATETPLERPRPDLDALITEFRA